MRNLVAIGQRTVVTLAAITMLMTLVTLVEAESLSPYSWPWSFGYPRSAGNDARITRFHFRRGWQLVLEAGIKADEVSVESLKEQLSERFHLCWRRAKPLQVTAETFGLAVAPGSVVVGEATDKNKPGLAEQAYH